MTRHAYRLLARGLRCGVAASLLLAGASQAQTRNTPSNDSDLSKRTKVLGVLVAAGARAHILSRGMLMHVQKDEIYVPTDEPLLADAIFEGLKAELDKEERYEVKRMAMTPDAARQYSDAIVKQMRSRTPISGAWNQLLTPYYESCGCDALLVVGDGRVFNEVTEVSANFGPSFAGRGGLAGQGEPEKAQFRVGLMFWLADPVKKEGVRGFTGTDIPDYSTDVASHWPGRDGSVAPKYWQGMADYLRSRTRLYQYSLFMIGLRPSCAMPYFDNDPVLQARGYAPPPLLPGTDPSRCVIAK